MNNSRYFIGLQYGYENALSAALCLNPKVKTIALHNGDVTNSHLSIGKKLLLYSSVSVDPIELIKSKADVTLSWDTKLRLSGRLSALTLKDQFRAKFSDLVLAKSKEFGIGMNDAAIAGYINACERIGKLATDYIEDKDDVMHVSISGFLERRFDFRYECINTEKAGVFSPLTLYPNGEVCNTTIIDGHGKYIARKLGVNENIAWLDLYTIKCTQNMFDKLVLTNLDMLEAIDDMYFQVGFKEKSYLPLSTVSVYEGEHVGFVKTQEVKKFNDLPERVLSMVEFIENYLGRQLDGVITSGNFFLQR